MKKLIVVLCIFALIGAVFFAFFSKLLSKGVLEAVNEFAPKITQTSVVLDDVELSAFSGSGKLSGLVVGNPEGFKTEHAMSLGLVSVKIEPKSVLSDKIEINEVLIDGPVIVYETNNSLKTNIGQILKNVESYVGTDDSAVEEEAEEGEAGAKKIGLKLFRMTNGKVMISNGLTMGKNLEISLPTIEVKDIGQGEEGATAGDVLKRILSSINKETIKAVAESGGDVGKQLEDIGKEAKKGLGGLLDGFKKSVKSE